MVIYRHIVLADLPGNCDAQLFSNMNQHISPPSDHPCTNTTCFKLRHHLVSVRCGDAEVLELPESQLHHSYEAEPLVTTTRGADRQQSEVPISINSANTRENR